MRTILRSFLSKQIYRIGANILNVFYVLRLHGLATYKLLYRSSKTNIEEYKSVNFKGYPYPVYFRPGKADVNTLVQNLVREEYGFLPSYYIDDIKIIIDGGSFIGDTAIYFLNRFKNCRVIALEPNKDNYILAKLNLKNYAKRVELLNKGLYSSKTKLQMTGSFNYSRITNIEDDSYEIEFIDIWTLMNNFGINRIDLLKLDVEGAEKEIILINSSCWLKVTRLIVVEFHERETKVRCTKFLQENGFEGYQYRSLHYFFNIDYNYKANED